MVVLITNLFSDLEDIKQIIEDSIANNLKAQKLLYENYYGYALKIVFRYVYRYEKAVDIVNDGYVKLFRNISKFQFGQPEHTEMMLMGWIRTIMINTAIDHLRKNNFLPEIGAIEENIWIEDRSQSADQNVLYKELVSQIKRLPPSYRAVFNMYIIDGLTHQEIANQLGISVGTSKSNLSKARDILQRYVLKSNEKIAVCRV